MIVMLPSNLKQFMRLVLKSSAFDQFEVRQAQIQTFTLFTISGILDKDYYPATQRELLERNYCLWQDLRPIVFDLVKGHTLPKCLKVIFSLSSQETKAFFPEASALFFNLSFENGLLSITTGCSQAQFSLDKTLDTKWDAYMETFLQNQNILYQKG